LTEAFNGMLDRLEGERRESARRALAAHEGERRRIARELPDEIGQVVLPREEWPSPAAAGAGPPGDPHARSCHLLGAELDTPSRMLRARTRDATIARQRAGRRSEPCAESGAGAACTAARLRREPAAAGDRPRAAPRGREASGSGASDWPTGAATRDPRSANVSPRYRSVVTRRPTGVRASDGAAVAPAHRWHQSCTGPASRRFAARGCRCSRRSA
jgi:hypothetical protein